MWRFQQNDEQKQTNKLNKPMESHNNKFHIIYILTCCVSSHLLLPFEFDSYMEEMLNGNRFVATKKKKKLINTGEALDDTKVSWNKSIKLL